MSSNMIITPRGRSVGSVSYGFGGKKSTARLRELDFDPIAELVKTYREVEDEVVRQKGIRDNTIVELSTTGRPKAYRPEVHHALLDKKIVIGDKLTRYMYGRVPENGEQAPQAPPALVVQLSQEGDTYVINDGGTEVNEDDDDNQ